MMTPREHALYAAGKHAAIAEQGFGALQSAYNAATLDHTYMRTIEIAIQELQLARIEAVDAGQPDLADTYLEMMPALADYHAVAMESDKRRIASDPLADTRTLLGL